MCGIFAALNHDDNEFATAMDNFYKGKHRGPDNSHFLALDHVMLGFHRLSIVGVNNGNQPFFIKGVYLICNGEIYNHKEILTQMNIRPETDSDCEVIIHLYREYGIEHTLRTIRSTEFAFVLWDTETNTLYTARDAYGVRPLYHCIRGDCHYFASELKMMNNIADTVKFHPPGTYCRFGMSLVTNKLAMIDSTKYVDFPSVNPSLNISDACNLIRNTLVEAVNVRVENTERPIACLLSGGLDSSLVTALVNKRQKEMGCQTPLETFSIGLEGAEDMKYAQMVADYLGTKHTNVVVTEHDFFDAIPEVIYNIESYDTTTVRASVGNYLVAKYIRTHSEAKVIFNGDGSDEVTGGYLYMKNAPTNIEFDRECKRLVSDIHCFDVLRSDKSISSNGLEARTPFLDQAFVECYFTIPVHLRNQPGLEKRLLREAFSKTNLLPTEVLWRKKEAFSDGVSSVNRSWFQIIKEKIPPHIVNIMNANAYMSIHNPPTTPEQYYYRMLFDKHYISFDKTIPYYWMPKYTNATDCSARLLYV